MVEFFTILNLERDRIKNINKNIRYSCKIKKEKIIKTIITL